MVLLFVSWCSMQVRVVSLDHTLLSPWIRDSSVHQDFMAFLLRVCVCLSFSYMDSLVLGLFIEEPLLLLLLLSLKRRILWLFVLCLFFFDFHC